MIFKKDDTPYKFKSLRSYAWDRVMNHIMHYRRVFDRYELNYLSVALEFFNKRFDEKDWKARIRWEAYEVDGDKKVSKICSEEEDHTITKDENVVVRTFGWGNEIYGKGWVKGNYVWEVYIDDEFVASSHFRIEDAGKVQAGENPYFEVVSLRTYEGTGDDVTEDQRVYLKQFSEKETRYIWSELKIINKLPGEWLCEIFYKYYDDTGVLVGVADSLGYITPDLGAGEMFTLSRGWGSEKPGTWIRDNYRVEVVFMDQVVAVIPFSVGDKNLERISDYEALLNEDVMELYGKTSVTDKEEPEEEPEKVDGDITSENEKDTRKETEDATTEPAEDSEIMIDDRPLEEIMAELDELVGLNEIKEKIREYVDYVSYLQYREEKGFKDEEEINLHSAFTGNPGTGKTTVVKLLGKIYHAMGLLSKGHVHEVESNDLISGYVRQTGKETKAAIEKARGGILFIDEAYMLYKEGGGNDFGPEAVAALIKEMSDGPGDIAIMMAGYPKEMESMINSNPGLRSRIRNHYHFDDYTPDELVEIAKYAARKMDVTLSEEALKKLKKIVTDAFRKRDRTFGNARLVHSLVDEAKMNLGVRLVREYDPDELTREMLATIEAKDIEDLTKGEIGKRLKLEVDEPLLKEALDELNELIGLAQIKQEIRELIRLTKYYREMDRDVLKAFSMHSIFTGNPGTGKTTVARIMGKIYKALGLLERGHLIDADGSDLIAGWVGQTAIKTKELVKKAMGGVLFIDEAYAITEGGGAAGGGADFGKKAIAALIKEMEDHRGEFAVIAAGYTDNMKRFKESNPGIQSRFDKTFHFEDFSESELWDIAVIMLKQKGLKADAAAEKHLKKYIAFLYAHRNKFFGNARSIRKIVEKAFRNQELRMAGLPKSKRTKKALTTLNQEDVREFVAGGTTETTDKSPSIGFKFGE